MRPALPWAVAAGGLSSLFVGVPLHNDAPFTSTPTYDKSANYLSSGKSGSFADAPDTKDEAATDGCKPHGWGFSFWGTGVQPDHGNPHFVPGSAARLMAGFLLPDP
jgi:hypothetical protein